MNEESVEVLTSNIGILLDDGKDLTDVAQSFINAGYDLEDVRIASSRYGNVNLSASVSDGINVNTRTDFSGGAFQSSDQSMQSRRLPQQNIPQTNQQNIRNVQVQNNMSNPQVSKMPQQLNQNSFQQKQGVGQSSVPFNPNVSKPVGGNPLVQNKPLSPSLVLPSERSSAMNIPRPLNQGEVNLGIQEQSFPRWLIILLILVSCSVLVLAAVLGLFWDKWF